MNDETRLDYVTAEFGGIERRLCIPRELLPAFEAYANVPAYALYTRIVAGNWTVRDLKTVIRTALLPERSVALIVRQSQQCGGFDMIGLEMATRVARGRDLVDEVFAVDPPAPLAVLAASILEAALVGIPADAAKINLAA